MRRPTLINHPPLALLVTYSCLTEEALFEGIVDRILEPLPGPSGPLPNKTLSVRYRGSIMWSIAVEKCQTWFVRSDEGSITRSILALTLWARPSCLIFAITSVIGCGFSMVRWLF